MTRTSQTTVRRGLAALVLALSCGWAAPAAAQSRGSYAGLFTPYLGVTAGVDADDAGLTAGASLAVIQNDGWGVELDVGHAVTVGDEGFDDSGLTSGMLNVLYVWPRTGLQPFGVAGAGVMHLSGAIDAAGVRRSRTEIGMMLGGGVHLPITELVGIRGDVRYLRFLNGEPDVPVGKGVFDTWRFSVGLTLNWPLEP